ncbi:unnamed protein product [Rotaria magnacalcarata]|uniref:Uncharacterized protein n=1 Tax=Rotaria magnacalcarata TaxID=392030 RepID=A0A816N5N5_9BILA|nr:unnamed protein product [Rotaria magnacalcarata]CAF3992822.1 unnamed protein product [Rotaria magnacalcarata]
MTYYDSNCNPNRNGKDVWSRITLEELVGAIASLEDRVHDLQDETWRLNGRNNSSGSLWGEVIDRLKLAHDEKIRHSLYNIWNNNRHNIQKLVARRKREMHMSVNTADQAQSENDGTSEKNKLSLHPDPSLPLPEHPNTRTYAAKNKEETTVKNFNTNHFSLAFSAVEWKETFSRTHQKMKDNWTITFYNKLTLSQVTCPVKFMAPYIKKGKRKRACRFFCCYAICILSMCSRRYQISLQEPPDENSSALFLVKAYGEENHDVNKEIAARQLDGVQRLLVGKRANEIGPLAVFQERLNNANEKLLAVGNYTECETIETLKKAASDYRKKMHFDEDIFKECRMISVVYEKDDVSSEHVQGYVHDLGELPLRSHLYTEAQIKRYINYCRREKYSYVHIDATGGVLKKMSDKNPSFLYAIMFKDGDDAFDTVPLAHAILTKHTVANIAFFFWHIG